MTVDPTGSAGLRGVGNGGAGGGGGGGGYGTERADVCLEVATVTEEEETSASASASAGATQPRSLMVCGGDRRLIHALVTRRHHARVQLHNPRMVNSIGMFLLQYSGQLLRSLDPL